MKYLITWKLVQHGTSEQEAKNKEEAIELAEANFDAGNFIVNDFECEGWQPIEIHEIDKFFNEKSKKIRGV